MVGNRRLGGLYLVKVSFFGIRWITNDSSSSLTSSNVLLFETKRISPAQFSGQF